MHASCFLEQPLRLDPQPPHVGSFLLGVLAQSLRLLTKPGGVGVRGGGLLPHPLELVPSDSDPRGLGCDPVCLPCGLCHCLARRVELALGLAPKSCGLVLAGGADLLAALRGDAEDPLDVLPDHAELVAFCSGARDVLSRRLQLVEHGAIVVGNFSEEGVDLLAVVAAESGEEMPALYVLRRERHVTSPPWGKTAPR